MTDHEIEQMLSIPDDELLSPETLKKVERREYSFVGKYLRSSDTDIRNTALCFIKALGQPWAVPYLFEALRDQISSNRALAARALRKLVSKQDRKALYAEIVWQDKTYIKKEDRITDELVLALGVVADSTDIPLIIELQKSEKVDSYRTAYQMALARCGHVESVNAIKCELAGIDETIRKEALDKLPYLANPDWVPFITPLLLDERIVNSFDFAGSQIERRVCDEAIKTLVIIDQKSVFPFPRVQIEAIEPFSKGDIAKVRLMYGISNPSPKD
jgi:HEAT repeat protein